MLFNSYDIANNKCLNMRNFIFMVLSEVQNNNQLNSFCQNCMKKTKYEIQSLFDYIDADGNGQITAEDLFNSFLQFNTVFPVSSTMVNSFILINDESGKASVNREEFVSGIVLGMAERELNEFGWVAAKGNPDLKAIRKDNAVNERGPQ